MIYINSKISAIRSSFIILLYLIIPTACTKVVDVDVPNGGERLIIEASINWEKGTQGNNQTILLSLSTPYFNESKFVPAQNAQVTITNVNSQEAFVFTEHEPGVYTTSSFVPVLMATYSLHVVYNVDTYEATSVLHGVPEINSVTQSIEEGFGSESIQVMVTTLDPANQKNFYYNEFWTLQEGHLLGRDVENDALSDGNNINFDFDDEGLTSGDNLDIRLYGVSEGYYNYMNLLLEQSEGGGGPFTSVPAKLIGNCLNVTRPNLETLGYFRLSEYSTLKYTVE